MIGQGIVIIKAYLQQDILMLEVEDNAGNYREELKDNQGLGLNLVHKRIQVRYGEQYGVKIECKPDTYTRVIISLPIEKEYK